MVNDLISDMLIRINNGYNNKLNKVVVLNSKICIKILKLLYYHGYINGFYFEKNGNIVVKLKYYSNFYLFNDYQRISKNGRRIYCSVNDLKKKYFFRPFVIVSTIEGLLLHRQAIIKNLGGEVLFSLNHV
jgi:small subunit ribosomal protein S8